MHISFTISSWVIPTIITIIAVAWFSIASRFDRKDKGMYFNLPIYSMLALIGGGIATVVAWAVWILTILIK